MKTIVLISAVLASALVGAEPPQYPYPQAGLRPQGAPFTLPNQQQAQQFNAPLQEYALPQTSARLILIQPGVQQSFQPQFQQQRLQQQQQFSQNYRLPFFFENQQQLGQYKSQQNGQVDIKEKYSKVSQEPNAKTTKESDAEEFDVRAFEQNKQSESSSNGRYTNFQAQPQYQRESSSNGRYTNFQAQPQYQRKNSKIQEPPRAYIPVTTTSAPTTTTDQIETTTFDNNDQFNGTKGRGDQNGRFTSPEEDTELINTEDNGDIDENAGKEGYYYLLLPNGQLQKVIYMTDEDYAKMSFSARLQYQNVDPIQGPIYTYNPETGNFLQIV